MLYLNYIYKLKYQAKRVEELREAALQFISAIETGLRTER